MDKEKLLFQSQAFCLMPWIHLHIQGNGEIKPCCVANQSIGKIENNSVQTVLENSEQLKKLKTDFENGIIYKLRWKCFNYFGYFYSKNQLCPTMTSI